MAKLKMLKAPKKPKLPKKPKANASVSAKENYIKRVDSISKAYAQRVKDNTAENARRRKENAKGDKLTAQIAGISGIGAVKSTKRRRR